jgi:hypothetical protein
MVDGRDEPVSTEKASRDRKSKSKVISDPAPRPPPAVPMPPGEFDLPTRKKPVTKEPRANVKFPKQAKADDDIVMVDAGGPSENIGGLKRSDSSAKRASLGGVFGGLLSKSRPEPKRRSVALTDDEATRGLRREDRKIKRTAREASEPRDVTMSGGATEEDQEARREARRVRRAEREAAEKAADEARRARDEERRDRRRKQEEEAEAKLQEEKDARRAARREARAREEEADRKAVEAKEQERAERRRARRAEKEAQLDADQQDADARAKKSERRRSYMEGPTDEEEDRRRRREERRRTSNDPTSKTSRRKSAPVVDDYYEPRSGRKSEYLPAEGPVYKSSKKKPAWPHSGTDSWVQDHSDAPPPPDDAPPVEDEPVDDPIADENARRELKKARRRSKYDEVEDRDDREERRRRKESRRAEREARDGGARVRSSEGSQGDGQRSSYRDSGYIAPSREPSAQGGLFSRFRKIAGV